MDVIIIGSGPAGCSAASTCLKAGLDVMIITDQGPRDFLPSLSKRGVGGELESIHPGVSSLLEKIGAAGAEVAATRARYTGIQVGNTYTPLGEDDSGVWNGMHIDRHVFDAQLLHRIRETGVVVRFNTEVEGFLLKDDRVIGIKTASTELYAKYIIDASGHHAIAGRKLKFRRRFFSPPFVCWTGISKCVQPLSFLLPSLRKREVQPALTRSRQWGEFVDRAHFIPHKNGWTWLAPTPPDHCAWTRLRVKGEKSFLPPEELKDCIPVGKIKAANMRWRLYRPVCKEGVVLCGDAAGILDPAAGQGILNALWSGMIAANAVVSCLQQPELEAFNLARYDDWFVRQYEEKAAILKSYYEEHGILK